MKWRLAVNLVALILIGLSLVDVAFVGWLRNELTERRRAQLYVAAIHGDSATDPAILATRARQEKVAYAWLDPNGARGGTDADLHDGLPAAEGLHTWRGRDALVWRGRAGRLWLVVHGPHDALAAFYAVHTPALWLLAGCGAVMLFFGAVFLRRSVLAPLKRLTHLVSLRDKEGMLRAGPDPADDLGRLGHAIIAMAHTLEEDRARIATQLQALETAQTHLVRAERLAVVGVLAAGLAHEIGNPLAVVAGFVELLQDDALEPLARRQALQRVSQELARIQRTLRQLLDFSRVPKVFGAGDVRDALRRVQLLLAPQECMRGVGLHMPALAEPLWVRVDTDSLVQVLINLLLNAADALGHTGTVEVSVTADVRSLEPQPCVRVDVDDSGPGLAPDVLPHVFEPFFTTKPAGIGTGLGLSVCERIVAAGGGDLSCGKSPLGGARFTILLAVAEAPEESTQRCPTAPASPVQQGHK